MQTLTRRNDADPFGPALPSIPLLAHIRQLSLQQNDSLFQLLNLRLKGCYVVPCVLFRCIKHYVPPQ